MALGELQGGTSALTSSIFVPLVHGVLTSAVWKGAGLPARAFDVHFVKEFLIKHNLLKNLVNLRAQEEAFARFSTVSAFFGRRNSSVTASAELAAYGVQHLLGLQF